MFKKINIGLTIAVLIFVIVGIGTLAIITIHSNQNNKYPYQELLGRGDNIIKKLEAFNAERGEDRGFLIEIDRKEERIILKIPYLSDHERKILKNKFGDILKVNITKNIPEAEQTD